MNVVSRHHDQSPAGQSVTPWGHLSPQVKLLFITTGDHPADWLTSAFSVDSGSDVHVEQAHTLAEGLADLRHQVFDAVLIEHDPQEHDALSVLDAIRTGSSDDQPIVILGRVPAEELSVACYEAGGDAYLCLENTTTRLLLWEISRAIQRHQMSVENRRWQQLSHQRLRLEQDETGRLLEQQRAIVSSDEVSHCSAEDDTSHNGPPAYQHDQQENAVLPPRLVTHYRELLRTYVIMGSGNLANEMTYLAQQLVQAEVTAQQVMTLHLSVVEQMVDGLGSRSARHLMNRADLLIMEVMAHLVENYRSRFQQAETQVAKLSSPDSQPE